MFRVDAGEEVTQAGQPGGEAVGLFGGEGGQGQTAGRGTEEGRADLTRPLQQAEDGDAGAVHVRPTRTQRLGHRQRDGVQGGT